MEPRHTNRPRAWPLILTLTSGYAAFMVSFMPGVYEAMEPLWLHLELGSET